MDAASIDQLDGTVSQVIFNSVVQYFPTEGYLKRSLLAAIRHTKPGGVVFVGDVRSFPLLRAYHTSVELNKSPDKTPCWELRSRIDNRVAGEQELTVDPAFFLEFSGHPRITAVEVRLKRVRYTNELSKFRYDVLLHVESETQDIMSSEFVDWQQGHFSLHKIHEVLSGGKQELLAIANIPNQRVAFEVSCIEVLDNIECTSDVGTLRKVGLRSRDNAIDPSDIWDMAEQLPYWVDISWGFQSSGGYFNAIFRRKQEARRKPILNVLHAVKRSSERRGWTNDVFWTEKASKVIQRYDPTC